MREWRYWTRNKLQILREYLPAFNLASINKSSERIYIDLMAGEPYNVDRQTGMRFDGSARLALLAKPAFTKFAFCELEPKAKQLQLDLDQNFPGYPYRIYPGDCNVVVDQVLRDLAPYSWAPTFAFIDQQAAEVHWATLDKIAKFRTRKWKTELWILASPAMIAKGVAGTRGFEFSQRVDRLYGTADWRRIQNARKEGAISAEQYRDEMVNLLRWRLESVLGYKQTSRIPMRMPSKVPIYDMVFATDHPVGQKIMTDLYLKAAQREPQMIAEAKSLAQKARDEKAGVVALFDVEPPGEVNINAIHWRHTPHWDPTIHSWW